MNRPALAARIRKERHNPGHPSFTLDIEFEIPAGFTILFGPSGAGKSTVLDCIAGLLRPDRGHISVDGTILFDDRSRIDLPSHTRSVAYVFQNLALFPHMSVEKNVTYGLVNLPKPQRAAKAREILQAFHIENLASRKPGEISGGERQRVALARSLVTSPKILLLDEPLSALDAELKTSIIADLRAWNSARQIPILYVTHSSEEADALGERTITLDHGKIAQQQ
ncbi:MAG TPA: ATP-binding cassette domain-containing protein [Candidatus Acidoferrum sp.]